MRRLFVTALACLAACDQPRPSATATEVVAVVARDFGEQSQSSVRSALIVDDSTLVAIFDPGHEIRVVNADGSVRTIGTRGDGPGELRDVAWIARDDAAAIVAVDAGRRVASRWSLNGQLLAEVKVDFPYLAGVWHTKDGAVVRSHNRSQTEVVFHRLDFAAKAALPWRRLPTSGSTYETCRYCYASVSPDGRLAMTAPDTLYRIARWSADGMAVASVSRTIPRVEFVPEERDSVLEMRAKAAREVVSTGIPAAAVQEMVKALPEPKWKPRFVQYGVLMDSTGTLFVQPNVPRDSSARIDVFSAEGMLCGWILLGRSSRLLDIDRGRVLVVRFNDDGAERLELLTLKVQPWCGATRRR